MRTLLRAAAWAIVLAHFLVLATDGLLSGFMPDEMMNLYGCWSKPLHWLFLHAVVPVSGSYRPMGAIFYLPLFAAFGLNPLPFRMVCFLLLTLNLALGFAVVRRLTGSFEAAIFSALLFAYHVHFSDLYYSSGTIYDLLAFAFYYSCLLIYVKIRQGERVPGWRQCAALCALFWLALDSKEIAVTLPLVLAAYEATHAKEAIRSRGSWLRWLAGPGRCIALMAALSAVYLVPRMFGPAAMTSNPDYRPVFSWLVYVNHLSHYLSLLLLRSPPMGGPAVLVFCGAALVVAVLLKNRSMIFAWALFMAGSLPVMFIPTRGSFVLYLPYLGLTMYVAAALTWGVAPVRERARRLGLSSGALGLLGLASLGVAALVLHAAHAARKPWATEWVGREQAKLQQVLDLASGRRQALRPGARVLLAGDPFPDDDWAAVLALRLYYRDRTLWVERLHGKPTLPRESLAQYDAVFEFPVKARE